MLTLEARAAPSAALSILAPVVAVGLTLVAGYLLFELLGVDGGRALFVFFVRPVQDLYGLGELAVKAAPLILIGVGLALGFRANVWNIGAEGQFALGAVAGGAVALAAHGAEGWWTLPAMIVAGALGGAAWAALPALFRTRFNTNEILTSLMLTYVGVLFLSYLVHGPLKSPDSFNFPESRPFGEQALLPVIVEGTRVHLGVLLAPLAVLGGWFVLARLHLGYQIRVIGLAPRAGAYAGFSQRRVVWATLLGSGALAGLAGVAEVAGPIGQLQPAISPGYGFTAIIVAFLGRLHPVGVFFAGTLIALSYLGGEFVQIELGLPLAVTGVFQGMLLFFVLGCEVLVRYRVRIGGARNAVRGRAA